VRGQKVGREPPWDRTHVIEGANVIPVKFFCLLKIQAGFQTSNLSQRTLSDFALIRNQEKPDMPLRL
jgi:hypothetical protein